MDYFIEFGLKFLISCTVSSYAIFMMLRAIFKPTYSYKSIYIISFVGVVSGWIFINFLFSPILNTLYSVIGVFLINLFLFKDSISKIIFYNIIIFLYLIIIESVSNLLFYNVFSIDRMGLFSLIPTVLNQLFVLSTYRIFILFCKRNTIYKYYLKECIFFFLLVIFEIFILYTIQTFTSLNEVSLFLAIIMICFLILDIYLLNLFDSAAQRNIFEKESILLKQQAEMTNLYYTNIEQKYKQSQKIVHDVRNHIQTLENLAYCESDTMSKDYTSQLCNRLNHLALRFKCDDPILTIIINDKMLLCDEKKIALELKIIECQLDYMEEFDRTTLFCNLLDNAIEACDQLEDTKTIEIRMHCYNCYQVINVKNNYNGGLKPKDNLFKSTKPQHLGIGLTNVVDVVNKYNGEISFDTDQTNFIVKIIFPLPEF